LEFQASAGRRNTATIITAALAGKRTAYCGHLDCWTKRGNLKFKVELELEVGGAVQRAFRRVNKREIPRSTLAELPVCQRMDMTLL
jgi:hypothetical protein